MAKTLQTPNGRLSNSGVPSCRNVETVVRDLGKIHEKCSMKFYGKFYGYYAQRTVVGYAQSLSLILAKSICETAFTYQ